MALRIPLSWLEDFVDCSLGAEVLAERLTVAGLEVETIERVGEGWDPRCVVVGEVLEVRAHPNADRLSVAQVKGGAGGLVQVVTGAPNIRAWNGKPLPAGGLKAPLALPGARLVDGHREDGRVSTLKAGKLRGERSEGMLCSELELGLSEAHEGIMLLPAELPTGAPLAAVLGDAVLVFDIKGGFAHLLSVRGVARELAAILGQPLKTPLTVPLTAPLEVPVAEQPGAPGRTEASSEFVRVEIAAPQLCSRYTALLVEGVDARQAAPFWAQQRLKRAGMRPISAAVDATNYAMLELGQPLHAFDYALLRAEHAAAVPCIRIRTAQAGETLVTLDGTTRALDEEMLLITDGGGAVGLAGVMGGLSSELSADTRTILLEAANFDFLNVRRTCHQLKLRSEAAERFGKRLSAHGCLEGSLRCAQLLGQWCGGRLHPQQVDVHPRPARPQAIALQRRQLEALLGAPPPQPQVVRILRALEFQVTEGEPLQVQPPPHRLDVVQPADLAEEVARIHGYDRFPPTQLQEPPPAAARNRRLDGTERLRDLLAACGLDEIITYSLISPRDEAALHPAGNAPPTPAALRLRNPLSAERSVLRRRLLPEGLRTLERNLRQFPRAGLFELGAAFSPPAPGAAAGNGAAARQQPALPQESWSLCAVLCGARLQEHWSHGAPADALDFFDLKGLAEALLQGLGITGCTWERGAEAAYHPGRAAKVVHPQGVLGSLGELHPAVSAAFGFKERRVCALEWDAALLISLWQEVRPLTLPSQHPPIHEDLAFVVEESLPAATVQQALYQGGAPLLRQARLFDVYQDARQLGPGKKSLAFALAYQSPERTLTEKDAAKIRTSITRHLKQTLNADLRDDLFEFFE